VDQEVLELELKADQILEDTLVEIANLFPPTDLDHALIKQGQVLFEMRQVEGKGRFQITMGRDVNGKAHPGSHSEEEELTARLDPDLQFVSSWVDALENANHSSPEPNRLVDLVTQRWAIGEGLADSSKMLIIPPDSVARQQYIQFAPGSNFMVMLKGKLAKLPIEVLHPWEYYSRKLPSVLEQQRPDWPYRQEVYELIKNMLMRVSQLFPMTEQDYGLVDLAKAEIRSRFADHFWQLASVFVTSFGNIGFGIQHDTKTGRANTDSEQMAIKKARRHYPGEILKTIVTVHHQTMHHTHEETGSTKIVMSCMLCRKSLLKYSPNVKAIIPFNGSGIGKVPMRVLYPLPDFTLPSRWVQYAPGVIVH